MKKRYSFFIADDDRIEPAFWGVHGTLPVPGGNTAKYGGNTSCISLEFSDGTMLIFDASAGIKSLSDQGEAKHPPAGAQQDVPWV